MGKKKEREGAGRGGRKEKEEKGRKEERKREKHLEYGKQMLPLLFICILFLKTSILRAML